MPIGQNFVGGLRTGLSAAQLAEDNKAEAARQRQQNMIEIGKKMQSDLQGVATTYEQKRKELQDKLDIETIPEVKAKYQREMQGLDLSLDKFKSHELTYWEDLQKSGVPASVLPPRFAIETLGGTPLSSKQEAQQAAQAEATKTVAEKRAALPFEQQKIRDEGAEKRREIAARGEQDRLTARLEAELEGGEQAPPVIGQILGSPNATIKDLKGKGVYIPGSQKELADLRGTSVGYATFSKGIADMLNLITSNPDVTSIGGFAEFAGGMKATATAAARVMGIEVDADFEENPGTIKQLESLGIVNAEMQSAVIGLAYAAAIASGEKGRLTDADIQRNITQIGADARDPEALQQGLMAFAERIENKYRETVRASLNAVPPKSIFTMDPSEMKDFVEKSGGFDKLSPEDQSLLQKRKKVLIRRANK